MRLTIHDTALAFRMSERTPVIIPPGNTHSILHNVILVGIVRRLCEMMEIVGGDCT